MPGRRYGRRRRSSLGTIVNSMKNVRDFSTSTGTTQTVHEIAIAKDNPLNASQNEVRRGCLIKAVWCSFDVCGLAATGALQRTGVYLIKNPGSNLTLPGVFTVGSSNEKKFIFRQWQFMTMRNQDGNPPNHWEGWIPIPKRYQRFGADDKLTMAFETTTSAGHSSAQYIYKWYS